MEKVILHGAATGFGAFLALVLLVFATGQTFGQRCAAAGFSGQQMEACIHRLSSN